MVKSTTETRVQTLTVTETSTIVSTVQVAIETLSQQPTVMVDSCRMELIMATIIPTTLLLVIGMLAVVILLACLLLRGRKQRYKLLSLC